MEVLGFEIKLLRMINASSSERTSGLFAKVKKGAKEDTNLKSSELNAMLTLLAIHFPSLSNYYLFGIALHVQH